MTYLLLFHKFKLLEVLRIQTALGLPGPEEEEGAARGDRDDGDGDGHRGLDALPVQEIHGRGGSCACDPPLSRSLAAARSESVAGLDTDERNKS